ncbi:MAG: hypothetical protein QNI99_00150 [Woeseiaceae bacterium]|nr:hypothetical protein [Woeseiaceae bacterium]
MTNHDDIAEKLDDAEHGEAYDFWIFIIAVAGAVGGYVAGSEFGFSLWPKLGLAFLGLVVFGSIAYRFRKIIAIVGAILVVIAIIAGIVEGILTA